MNAAPLLNDLSTILAVIGITAGLAIYTMLIIKYLVERIDNSIKEERAQREADVKLLAAKEELNKHIATTERQIDSMREDLKLIQTHFVKTVTDLGIQINTRLDQMLINFVRSIANNNNNTKEDK